MTTMHELSSTLSPFASLQLRLTPMSIFSRSHHRMVDNFSAPEGLSVVAVCTHMMGATPLAAEDWLSADAYLQCPFNDPSTPVCRVVCFPTSHHSARIRPCLFCWRMLRASRCRVFGRTFWMHCSLEAFSARNFFCLPIRCGRCSWPFPGRASL